MYIEKSWDGVSSVLPLLLAIPALRFLALQSQYPNYLFHRFLCSNVVYKGLLHVLVVNAMVPVDAA